MQRSALCRSRREFSNEYLLAKFGFDTAENEPCKVRPLSAYRSPRCEKLTSLLMYSCDNITDTTARHVAKLLRIESVHIRFCEKLTKAAAAHLEKRFKCVSFETAPQLLVANGV